MRLFVEKKPAAGTPTDTDKPNDGQTGDTTSPQTGDDSNIALWMALMLAAGAALTGTAVYSRKRMLMYGKEASNRKQEIDRQHYTIPNQRPKDKHCGKI